MMSPLSFFSDIKWEYFLIFIPKQGDQNIGVFFLQSNNIFERYGITYSTQVQLSFIFFAVIKGALM